MKVDVKKVDDVRRELKFEVPKERVASKLEDVYKDISKEAKVKGYRQGKVPRQVLEANYGKIAQEEVVKKIVPEAYQEAIEKEGLVPIDLPDISDVDLKNGAITFKATLDLKPEIILKNYKGLKVKRKSSEVTDEEINKTLGYFKQGQGDDEKEVVLDDAFARGLGHPNLEDFKNSLRRQLEMDKDRHNRHDVENQVIEALLKQAKFTVPQSLVHKQIHHRIEETVKRMKSQGATQDEIKKKADELHKELKEPSEKDVKVYLILDKIAQEEKIMAKEGENVTAKTIEFLLKEAKWEE